MTKRKLFVAILVFILFDVAVWLGSIFVLPDTSGILVGFVLTALGLTVLVVYVLVSRITGAAQTPKPPSAPETPGPAPRPAFDYSAPVRALIQEANERLSKSPTLASQRVKSTITDFPLYFVLGAEGSGKTSLFLASKSAPELLAGKVHQESVVVPTRLGNIWFADSAVIVEGAGDFFSGEDSRWKEFLSYFHRPGGNSRFARIFGGHAETRLSGVLLCCDASPYAGVPDAGRLAAVGRLTQARLRTVGEVFGRDFPVYVVFTKSDSIPYFGEYFGRLTEAEDSQVLGCAFPEQAGAQSLTNETITAGLNKLYLSLADKRLEYLEREKNPAKRPAIYEFPREFKRLRGPLGQFLLDVFRTNPLQPNPRLLGVYFAGTRKVVGQPADLDRSAIHKVGDVTRILRADDLQRFRTQLPDARESEPEMTRWSFVSDLWQQILHRRPSAGASLPVNRRQEFYRKVAYISVAAFFGLASLIFSYSFLHNYSLVSEVEAATEAVPPGAAPSVANLQHLDGLRKTVETLAQNKPGVLKHFGFYEGGALLGPARRVYFDRFREYFLNPTVRRLEDGLSGLPFEENPSYTYMVVYDDLKTYRTIAKSPNEVSCTPDSALGDRLMATWRKGQTPDAEAERIAGENFRFYISNLKSGGMTDELQVSSKDNEVQRGRTYLSTFRGVERRYQQIIEQVNGEKSPARLSDLAGKDKYLKVLRVDAEVPAAYTLVGWPRVQELINSVAGGDASDSCVLGSGGSRLANIPIQTNVKAEIQSLYIQDYIRHWRDFLAHASLLPIGACGDAAEKLGILKENDSPILAVLLLATENTTFPKRAASATEQATETVKKVSKGLNPFGGKRGGGPAIKALADIFPNGATEDEIAKAFQPAHAVFETSPPSRDRWTDQRNTPYLDSLGALWQTIKSLDRGGKCDQGNQALNSEAIGEVAKAQKEIDSLARNFDSRGVYEDVKALLESPLRGVRKLFIGDPTEPLKRRIAGAQLSLCRDLGNLKNKYPFNPLGTDADVEQVRNLFDLKSGSLAALRQSVGDLAVITEGNWSQKPDAPIRLSPEFWKFLNRMSEISAALFPTQGIARYKLSVQTSSAFRKVTGTINGQPISIFKEYAWPPSNGEIDLRVELNTGGTTALSSYSGVWAMFRLLSNADHKVGTNLFPLVVLKAEGAGSIPQPILEDRSPVTFEVTQFPNGVRQAFDRDFFAVSCPKGIFE